MAEKTELQQFLQEAGITMGAARSVFELLPPRLLGRRVT
jgi:hypothetical protein